MTPPFDLLRVYPGIETSLRMIERDDLDDGTMLLLKTQLSKQFLNCDTVFDSVF